MCPCRLCSTGYESSNCTPKSSVAGSFGLQLLDSYSVTQYNIAQVTTGSPLKHQYNIAPDNTGSVHWLHKNSEVVSHLVVLVSKYVNWFSCFGLEICIYVF